jgi:hypothetical protein
LAVVAQCETVHEIAALLSPLPGLSLFARYPTDEWVGYFLSPVGLGRVSQHQTDSFLIHDFLRYSGLNGTKM